MIKFMNILFNGNHDKLVRNDSNLDALKREG